MPILIKKPLTILFKVKQGFTLIELLIVITIIGILASLTLASYGNAQAKGRDGVRKSDLAQIKRALELAKADCTGSAWYPKWAGTDTATLTTAQSDYDTMISYLANANLNYISGTIEDPKKDQTAGQKYGYWTKGTSAGVCPDTLVPTGFTQPGASSYVLSVKLERTADNDAVQARSKCSGKPGSGSIPPGGWNDNGYYVICNN